MVETTAIPRKNPASSSRTIDGQAVIAISDQAQIVILNEVGTRVWNLIDGSRNFQEITALVTAQIIESDEFEQLPSDISADIEAFLEDLASRGMISMGGAEASPR